MRCVQWRDMKEGCFLFVRLQSYLEKLCKEVGFRTCSRSHRRWGKGVICSLVFKTPKNVTGSRLFSNVEM